MNAIVTLESILTPAAAPLSAETLFGTGQVETIVTAIEAQVRGEAIDISTADGRKAAKSLAYKVARSKTILDEIGKEHVADIKAQSTKIDKERKTLRDRLDALNEEVRGPVEKWEQAEEDRVSGLEGALVAVIEAARQAAGKPASLIRELIELVAGYSARDWQEFKERADVAVTEALVTLNGALADAEQRERDAAELEALRAEAEALRAEKAAREEADRIEAYAKAQAQEREKAMERERERQEQARRDQEAAVARAIEQERQRAEQARIEAEQKAEREKLAAVEAERCRQEQEARDAAAKKAAEEAAEQKRQANKRHRAKIELAVLNALATIIGEHSDAAGPAAESAAENIVHAIAAGNIPHVSITY